MKKEEPEKTGKIRRNLDWTKILLIAALVICISIAGGFGLDHYSRVTPNFCATCHNMESHVVSYLESTHLDNVHYQANVGCKDCHADYSIPQELASVWSYVTGDYDKVFRKQKYESEMCTQCHISEEYQATQTDYLQRNPHLSHYPDMRCESCHISHGEQVDYCSQCHDNGGQRMTGAPIEPRSENPFAES